MIKPVNTKIPAATVTMPNTHAPNRTLRRRRPVGSRNVWVEEWGVTA
jgi:hypothetical protein